MGKIIGLYLMPHPPIIIPEIGRGQEKKIQDTIDALGKCGREISQKAPETIILITPHGPAFRDAVAIMAKASLKGDFARFGAKSVSLSFENNLPLVESITTCAQDKSIPCIEINRSTALTYDIETSLDWGALVPLYFINKYYKEFKLVHITYSFFTYDVLYQFGELIQNSVESQNGDVVVIASGDLSHRLTEDGPYGFDPMGPKLDRTILNMLKNCDVEGLMNMDPHMVEEGGECGLRSLIIGLGALSGKKIRSDILSYEGPFGVGYGVVSIEPVMEGCSESRSQKADPYVELARKTVEEYITAGEIIKPPLNLPKYMFTEKAGVFVTLKKQGQLRGCIGTINPVRSSIAEEIIYNAISAATEDPRFFPVTEDELKDIVYSVDLLGKAEPVDSLEDLDPREYGVIVQKGFRRGLLLPDLEGVDTPQQQISIALGKAGIHPEERYKLQRFKVHRHV